MKNWLTNAVVYEIYPQSFYDTNADGIGDLRGIMEKLDYIQDCGFTAIWLNPINPSSFRDAGYDVTDFYDVAPRYGTLDDYKALCDAVHARGMKIIFDLVAGHTSIDHPWFVESAKATPNEYSNRYIWTTDSTFDPGEGIAGLGERDGKVIENFFWCQPALNYGYAHPDPNKPWQLPVDHPDCVATKEELKKIIAFWMDLGTDAFRVDMAASLIKGDTDNSFMTAFWHEIREFMLSKNPDSLLISEWDVPDQSIPAGFHLDFLLHSHVPYVSLFRYEKGRNTFQTFLGEGHSYFAPDGRGNINDFLDAFIPYWEKTKDQGYIGFVTGNHDMQRLAYRRTPEEIKVAMAFLFTMPGVPFVYYGDEIGMDYLEGLPSKEGGYIRTGARTPMQWNEGKNHGFSESDAPYLPTDSRPGAPTVSAQEQDETSLLSFVKKLIAFYKKTPALWPNDDFEVLLPQYPFVFTRGKEEEKYLIAVNPSQYDKCWKLPCGCEIVMSQNAKIEGEYLELGGISFVIAKMES